MTVATTLGFNIIHPPGGGGHGQSATSPDPEEVDFDGRAARGIVLPGRFFFVFVLVGGDSGAVKRKIWIPHHDSSGLLMRLL